MVWLGRNEYEESLFRVIENLGPRSGKAVERELFRRLEKLHETDIALIRPLAAVWAENAIPNFLNLLDHPNPFARRLAAQYLAEAKEAPDRVIPFLVQQLENNGQDPLALSLKHYGALAEPAIPILINQIFNYYSYHSGVEILKSIGSSSIRPLLDAYLDLPDAQADNVASKITSLGARMADWVPVLIEQLDHPVYQRRLGALRILGAIGIPALKALPRIVDRLGETQETRDLALKAIAAMECPEEWNILLEKLASENLVIKMELVSLFSKMDPPVEILNALLSFALDREVPAVLRRSSILTLRAHRRPWMAAPMSTLQADPTLDNPTLWLAQNW